MTTSTVTPFSIRPFVLALAAWCAAAAALAASGAVDRAPPLVPLVILGSIAACVVAYRRAPRWRARVDAVPLAWLLALHVARAPIGLWLLLAYRRGILPGGFAIHAGWGDLAVGLLAAPLVGYARAPRARRWIAAWNWLGLADIAAAVIAAQVLLVARHDPLLRAHLPHLPYLLLPAVIVPVVVVAHLAIAARLRRDQ